MALDIELRDARIERYFPDVLANSNEFIALGQATDPELKLTWQALIKQMLNTFIYDLDIDGAARWEEMLSLHPLAADSLSTRKKRILVKINSTLPYTFRSFQNMLDGVYGEGNTKEHIDADAYKLWIDLSASVIRREAEVRRLARVIVPANLTIGISNTQDAYSDMYVGALVAISHKTVIEAALTCNLTGDYPAEDYRTVVVSSYKHIVIGGQ